MTMPPASGTTFKNLLIQGGRFLLTQLGYTCCDQLQRTKYYRVVWGLLLSYTYISFRALVYDDAVSILINLICTLQIFVALWGDHKEYIIERHRKAKEMAKKNNAIPIGKTTDSSPWGIRMVIYLVLFFGSVVNIVYRVIMGDWSAFGDFSIVAFVIAFVDSGIEILIGIFGATIDG